MDARPSRVRVSSGSFDSLRSLRMTSSWGMTGFGDSSDHASAKTWFADIDKRLYWAAARTAGRNWAASSSTVVDPKATAAVPPARMTWTSVMPMKARMRLR